MVADYVVAGRCTCCGHKQTAWSPQTIVDAIHVWAARHGAAPRFRNWRNATPEHPSATTTVEIFGSFNRAIAAAGLKPAPVGRPAFWTKRLIADAMLDFLAANNRWPRNMDWRAGSPVRPTSWTVYQRFGSWEDAVDFASGKTDPALRGIRVGRELAPCSSCGCESFDYTLGCSTCGDRRRKRDVRAAAQCVPGLVSVETAALLTPDAADGESVGPEHGLVASEQFTQTAA